MNIWRTFHLSCGHLVFALGDRSIFLVLKTCFPFTIASLLVLDFFEENWHMVWILFVCIFSTISKPSTPLSFLPVATYLILEIGGNGFFYAYSRCASPQIVIDEIVAESLNVLVSTVEVKKTCQQPLYIEINWSYSS